MTDFDSNHHQLSFHLGRIEGKVDALLHSRDRHEASIAELQTRLGELESSKARLGGIQTAISAAISLVVSAFTLYFLYHPSH
jgi:hypothetical protein